MALHDVVIPGVMAAMRGIVQMDGTPLFTSVDWGYQLSALGSPACWVTPASLNAPRLQGSANEESVWQIEVKVLCEWTPDQTNSEAVLAACIEPVRAAFRAHVKMSTPTVAWARVSGASWGWIDVNGVAYRSVDILCEITEKEPRTYAP